MRSTADYFQPGDVLYGRLRPYLNKVVCLDFEGLCSSEFIVFRKQAEIESRYLLYFLSSWSFVSFSTHLNTGDRPRVDFDQLADYPFPLAPTAEQRRIVAALETQFTRLDAGVAALKRLQANLKRYKAAVLKAACEGRLVPQDPADEPAADLLARILAERRAKWEADQRAKGKDPRRLTYPEPAAPDTPDLPELPPGWVWATFEATSEVQGGIQKQPKRRPVDNAYPYLRVANVLRGKLDLSEITEFELFREELDTYRLEPGDLLIVEGNGSRDQIGRCAIWLGEIENCVHQNHIIRARFSGIMPEYVAHYLNSPTGIENMMFVASSTSGLYTLSVGKVNMIFFPLPPIQEQKRIVDEIERLVSIVDELTEYTKASLQRAERLRQSILKEAFAGRLVPQDADDQPAAVLLARIRHERAERKGQLL